MLELYQPGDAHRLTTEMGEGRGCENDETMTVYKNALKLIYCPWGGGRDFMEIIFPA